MGNGEGSQHWSCSSFPLPLPPYPFPLFHSSPVLSKYKIDRVNRPIGQARGYNFSAGGAQLFR